MQSLAAGALDSALSVLPFRGPLLASSCSLNPLAVARRVTKAATIGNSKWIFVEAWSILNKRFEYSMFDCAKETDHTEQQPWWTYVLTVGQRIAP
jgi:hypothetical protein